MPVNHPQLTEQYLELNPKPADLYAATLHAQTASSVWDWYGSQDPTTRATCGGNPNEIAQALCDDKTTPHNTLFSCASIEQIDGSSGKDVIDGGAGNDWVMGSWATDRIKGGEGKDQITGGGGADDLFGGAGDDTLIGDSSGRSDSEFFVAMANHGADYIDGEGGDDYIEGGGKDDQVPEISPVIPKLGIVQGNPADFKNDEALSLAKYTFAPPTNAANNSSCRNHLNVKAAIAVARACIAPAHAMPNHYKCNSCLRYISLNCRPNRLRNRAASLPAQGEFV